MKTILNYKFPIFLVVILYFFHLSVRDFSNPYQKPINADAKAYYAYLPAIFIYHDSQFNFVKSIDDKYYKGFSKDFLNVTTNGKKVNKTFPGAAVLYLPFFLLAHFIALLFGLNADGYSYVYQFLFDFGYWFYLFLGSIYYVKLFRQLKFNDNQIYFSLFILLLGTNIFFYSVVDVTVTHIMNFALINAVIYHALKLQSIFKVSTNLKEINQRLFYLITLLLLIGITRPTNILIFLVVLIFIPQKEFYIRFIKSVLYPKRIIIALGLLILIGSIPFLLWHWQTQHWIVYSYGKEGFDFSNPQIFNFLWSYKKGWFVYTPLALITMIFGLFYLYKQSKIKVGLIILFYASSVYIFSSWWCWYYGAGLSQRVMIDFSSVLGLLILVVLSQFNRIVKQIFIGLSVSSMVFNLILTYQVTKGIYPLGSPSKEIFWDNFLSLQQKMRVYEKDDWKMIEKIKVSLNSDHVVKGHVKKGHQNYFIQTNTKEPYSPSVLVNFKQPSKKIIITFKALPQTSIDKLRLVVFNPKKPNKLYPIFLKQFCSLNKECKMEALVEFDIPTHQVEFYFWNANTNEICDFYDINVSSF